jgi:hypothetical protein
MDDETPVSKRRSRWLAAFVLLAAWATVAVPLVRWVRDAYQAGRDFVNDLAIAFGWFEAMRSMAIVGFVVVVVLLALSWLYRKWRGCRLPGLWLAVAGVVLVSIGTPIAFSIAFKAGRSQAIASIRVDDVAAEAARLWEAAQEPAAGANPLFSPDGERMMIEVEHPSLPSLAPHLASLHADTIYVERSCVVIVLINGGTIASSEGMVVAVGEDAGECLRTSPVARVMDASYPVGWFDNGDHWSVVETVLGAR